MDEQHGTVFFKIYGHSGKAEDGDLIHIKVPKLCTLADALTLFKKEYKIRRNNFIVKAKNSKEFPQSLWAQTIIQYQGFVKRTTISNQNVDFYTIDQNNPIHLYFNEHLR